MSSIFLKWFGWGKIPFHEKELLKQEGIICFEEGISSSLTYKKYKSSQKIHNYKFQWFLGGLLVTEKRLVVTAFNKILVNVLFSNQHFEKINFGLDSNKLSVQFDVLGLIPDSTGSLTIKLKDKNASQLYSILVTKQKNSNSEKTNG